MGAAQSSEIATGADRGTASGDATIDAARPAEAMPPPDSPNAVATVTQYSGPALRSAQAPERPLPVVEGYEIISELGRGGMGVVYHARQVQLNRPCVLKMILAGAHADTEAAGRFRSEAEAIAQVQHPNVVQIHHVGQAAGLPFLELEYVEGGSLDRQLDGTPWPPRRAAELVQALAQGVAEAHRLGIVHRDLKPGNVLLAAGDVPKITDFGLAKSLNVESGLTQTGQIMGSPGYMAPEQAAGKTRDAGPPADVYALCAILYELLTGRPPFRGATVLETLEQARTAEPAPPSRLVPGLPRDVETIALKGLRKEPAKRYDSAPALAADLRRFLLGEPIVARPVGPGERAWRWCRRHPASASLSAVILLVAALGLAGILWQWREAVTARGQVEATLVDTYTANGILAGDQGDDGRAALWFASAARLAKDDPDRRRLNAIRARTWGRHAFEPRSALVGSALWPGELTLHSGGRHLISRAVSDDKTRDTVCTLWDTGAEEPVPFPGGAATVAAAAWSPDGRQMAVGLAEGDVIIVGFPDGGKSARIPFPGRIRSLSFGADGRYLAIAAGTATRIWDCRSGAFATPALVHPATVTSLALHSDGRWLATGCRDGHARLFAVGDQSAKPLWPPVPHAQAESNNWYPVFGTPPLFVDGGRGLVTYSGKNAIILRTTMTGAVVWTLEVPEEDDAVSAIRVSPDQRYLAAITKRISGAVRLFDVATGRPAGSVLAHKNVVFDAAFSPDGRTLVTGSTDGTARLWTVPGGEPVTRPMDLHRTVHRVAFAPDGKSLLTQDHDLIRQWTLPQDGLPTVGVPLDEYYSFAALSPDGALAIATGTTFRGDRGLRGTRAFHVATGEPAGPLLRPGGMIVDATFSPDGTTVATLATPPVGPPAPKDGHQLQLWDWANGKQRWRATLPSEPRSVCFRPDGRVVAVLCGGGELIQFDPADGGEVRRRQAHEPERADHWVNNGKLGYSPDGRALLIWGMGKDVQVWEADSGQPRYSPLMHKDKCHDLQFAPDGRSMVLASYDGSVRIRDLASGEVQAELPAHPDKVYTASFSRDGRLLVTACRDRSVRVWDWQAGKLVCPPLEHGAETLAAAFTPNGHWVLSVSYDGSARAWDCRTGKPVTPSLALGGQPLSVLVTPDGRHAVVSGFRTELAVVDLAALDRADDEPDSLCRWAELLAGQALHEGGGTVNLSAAEWLERWRSWRGR